MPKHPDMPRTREIPQEVLDAAKRGLSAAGVYDDDLEYISRKVIEALLPHLKGSLKYRPSQIVENRHL